jgi:uncharacterized membrane protein
VGGMLVLEMCKVVKRMQKAMFSVQCAVLLNNTLAILVSKQAGNFFITPADVRISSVTTAWFYF